MFDPFLVLGFKMMKVFDQMGFNLLKVETTSKIDLDLTKSFLEAGPASKKVGTKIPPKNLEPVCR